MADLLKYFLKNVLYFHSSFIALTLLFIAYLVWFQPPFYFPKPTGQYAVGIKTYHWVDVNRKETLADDLAYQNRELMVSIWFPINGQLAEEKTTPYIPCVNYFQKNKKRTWFLVKHTRPIFSWQQRDVALSTDMPKFPVIIFSHGFGCTHTNNTAQCEELASHGYIVVGIGHTYDSSIVQFPDGRIADGIKFMEKRVRGKNFMEVEALIKSDIEIWISDVHFVLDQLERLSNDKESMLYQRLDEKNIGMFGHSFGGATTIQMCRRDSRIKAGVALDGPLYGPDATKNSTKPCMFLMAEDTCKTFGREPMDRNDWKKHGIRSLEEEAIARFEWFVGPKQLVHSMGSDAYIFVIKNSKHLAFCDNVLLKHASPFSFFVGDLESGAINGFRATKIINVYLVNFFNKYLKGKPSGLLDGEVTNFTDTLTLHSAIF